MANTYRTVNLTAGAGVDDKKIKVSIDDKQHEFIEQKLLSGSSKVSITVQDPGLIEKLLVDIDETQINHDNLFNFDVNKHRPLNDSSITTEELWSSSKIDSELQLKVDKVTSTDNAVTRFNGIGGDVQDSGVIIDDSNNVTGINDLVVDGNFEVKGTLTALKTVETYVTDANITINKDGTRAMADAQASGLTVEMTDAVDVILGYASYTDSKMVLGELGSESEIITSDHVQVLNNKTISFDPSGSDLSSTTISDALKELDQDKANINLDNLEANPSGEYKLYSDITFDQEIESCIIRSKSFTYGEDSNTLRMFSGAVSGANSGFLEVISGHLFNSDFGNTGGTWYGSGRVVDPSSPGNTGYAALSSGSVQSGTSGGVYIFSGLAYNGGSRGNIELDAPLTQIISGNVHVRDGFIDLLDGSSSVSNRIINLADPIDDQDAMTKSLTESLILAESQSIRAYSDSKDAEVKTYSDIQDLELKDELTSEGDIFESQSELLDSQTGTNVSGLSFNGLVVRSFTALVSVEIDADTNLFEEFEIHGINKGSSWEISYDSTGDDTLVTFDIDNLGQVVYNSSSYTNFVSGFIKYRSITTSVD